MKEKLFYYSFFAKCTNTRKQAIELIKTTDKPIYYRHGFAYRGAEKREVTKEFALERCNDAYLDVTEYEDMVIVNTFSENDMW